MPKRIEIAEGTVFNKLTYLHDVPRIDSNRIALFECECGSRKVLPIHSVRTSIYKSCGCDHHIGKHGHCKNGVVSSLHKRWAMMKYRCDNPKSKDYSRYGGRGITICSEWYDFKVFAEWAQNAGYAEHLTIDRKDNSKGYYPANCRWVSQFVQQANQPKENNRMHQYIGVRQLQSGNWQAVVNNQNTAIAVGTYPTEIEAVIARNDYITTNNLPHTINDVSQYKKAIVQLANKELI